MKLKLDGRWYAIVSDEPVPKTTLIRQAETFLRDSPVFFSLTDRRPTDCPPKNASPGSSLAVTERLERFSRSEITGKIKDLGGAVSGSVSKKTDYLVTGEDAGSKFAEAEKLDVTVLTEDEFLQFVEQRPG